MSTTARKARKRAGIRHERRAESRPIPRGPSLGLMSCAEWIMRFLARPS